jgi:hypothetical protein
MKYTLVLLSVSCLLVACGDDGKGGSGGAGGAGTQASASSQSSAGSTTAAQSSSSGMCLANGQPCPDPGTCQMQCCSGHSAFVGGMSHCIQ